MHLTHGSSRQRRVPTLGAALSLVAGISSAALVAAPVSAFASNQEPGAAQPATTANAGSPALIPHTTASLGTWKGTWSGTVSGEGINSYDIAANTTISGTWKSAGLGCSGTLTVTEATPTELMMTIHVTAGFCTGTIDTLTPITKNTAKLTIDSGGIVVATGTLVRAGPSGYDLVGSDGGVFVFPTGQSGGFFGSLPGLGVHVNNIVGMVPTTSDEGYFLVGSDGGVFAFGTAPFLGSLPGRGVTPTQPITGIVAADTDKGYFLVGRDGGVFAFGTVPFLGSLPGKGISVDNIMGIASTPTGDGYWLVSATGTVYGFGAARALGTAKGTSSPVSAIAGTPTGGGYWITTQNGTVDAFGKAKKFGTLPGMGVSPAKPVIGIVHTANTGGYWLLGADGGIFAFGDAGFDGSLPGLGVNVDNIVGAVPTSG